MPDSEYFRRYYLANRERIKEATRTYQAQHREEDRERQRKWRAANWEKIRAEGREKYRKNVEQESARKATYYRENREAVADRHRRYLANPEKKARRAEYLAGYRTRANELSRKRYRESAVRREYMRAVKKRSPLWLSAYAKLERCTGLCYICGLHVERERVSLDHVVPVSKGGPNDPGNVMPTHLHCNIAKRARLDYPIARPDLLEVASGR